MSLTKYETVKATIEYQSKRIENDIQLLSRRMDLTQKQKIKIGDQLAFLQAVKDLMELHEFEKRKILGKLPPQAMDMEEFVLGAILLEQDAIDQVKSFLLPNHFYSDSHKEIYQCILDMANQNLPINFASVIFQLRKLGKIDLVGGPAYIAGITNRVSSVANIVHNARCMVEMAIKRELILYSSTIHELAYDDSEDCFQLLDKCEADLKEIRQINIRQ